MPPVWARISLSAAISLSLSSAMRTMPAPASASWCACATVCSTSRVRVAHIDCTTTGASPPTVNLPILTARVLRPAVAGSILLMLPDARSAFQYRALLVLVLFRHRHRDRAMTEGRARAHRRRHPHRLGDLFIRASFFLGAGDVRLDTPGALRHMRGRDRHQLLGLAGNCTVLEHHLVEIEKPLERLRRHLAQLAEMLGGFLAIEISHCRAPRASDRPLRVGK